MLTIIDLSKYHMSNLQYGFMKNRYESDVKLLFTETDSLCYDIKTEDFYQDVFPCEEQFDLSEMKIKKSKDSENKKVVSKFKDET